MSLQLKLCLIKTRSMKFSSVSYGRRASRCSSVRRIGFTSWPTDCTGICVTRFFSVQNSSQTAFLSHGLTRLGFSLITEMQIFLSKYVNGIMKTLSCENHEIPAIMSWPYCFPLISLEVCLPQCWICSSGFHPSVWIQPRRLHNWVAILAVFAAFCSALLLTSVVHGLRECLKVGKTAYLYCEREKSFTHY